MTFSKKPFLFATVTATLIALTGCATATAQTPSSIDKFDMQRCVNMGNSLENAKSQKWGGGENIAPEDFARIKARGFDTVRIPVRWNDYAGAGPDFTIEPAFANHVKEIVDSALAHDLNVILNIHHFHELMDDPAAEMAKFEALWEQIAPQFADYSDDLWFEFLNEPSKELTGEVMLSAQDVAVKIIRKTNPDRVIILGGEFWSNVRQLETNIAPPDANIVYTFHYYEPFDFTHYLAEWTKPNMPDTPRGWGSPQDRADLKAAIDTVKSYRDKVSRPVFLGEFGAYTSLEHDDRMRWIEAVRSGMEAADVPWCLWAYANTFPVYDAVAEEWDRDTVSALGLTED
jgi:endoglucanase